MNTPTNTNVNGTASTVLSAAKCALEFLTVTNTSSARRYYALIDAPAAPTLPTATNVPPAGLALLSPPIAASGVWTAFPVDAAKGLATSRGLVLMSFGANAADGSPNFTALSAADANVVAWTAALA